MFGDISGTFGASPEFAEGEGNIDCSIFEKATQEDLQVRSLDNAFAGLLFRRLT